MLSLPLRIEVTVVSALPPAQPQPGLLVTLDLYSKARYYYGTLLGLTTNLGVVATSREAIEAEYQRQQRAFPMDYKLGLEDCDPLLRIGLPGGADFRAQSQTALGSGLLSTEARSLWAAARNATVASVEELVHLRSHRSLEIVLRVRPASSTLPDGAI